MVSFVKDEFLEAGNFTKNGTIICYDSPAIQKNVFDVVVILDYSIFRTWSDLNNNDRKQTISQLKNYFGQILNEVNSYLKTIKSSKNKYAAKLVSFYIAEDKNDSTFSEEPNVKYGSNEIDLQAARFKFGLWTFQKLTGGEIPKFDVAIAFTAYGGDDRDANGFRNMICTEFASGIVRLRGFYQTATMTAYLIGNIMGIWEDGVGNECQSGDRYIMAGNYSQNGKENFQTFSNCSSANFDEVVEGANKFFNTTCLREPQLKYENITKYLKSSLGNRYNLDQQCKFILGPDSHFCGMKRDESICERLYCMDTKLNECRAYTGSRAYDGTRCASKKWCLNKKCVDEFLAKQAMKNAIVATDDDDEPSKPGPKICYKQNSSTNIDNENASNKTGIVIVPKNVTIEILAVLDHSMFKRWMMSNNNDRTKAISDMKTYFAHMINEVDNNFKKINTSKYGHTYSVHLVDFLILESKDDSSFTENPSVQHAPNEINMTEALGDFAEWIEVKHARNELPTFDVAVAITELTIFFFNFSLISFRSVCHKTNIKRAQIHVIKSITAIEAQKF
ncbi:hypothetical protein HELRODRAFT_177845 [Helobdella robusta]|uniref:Peptidase M12B domain-containing protein n=1 Tax=Helobdella robusta TaxID=6412 RepID=T1FCD1_HELRO|nr:hypothetical protein HELRODRAFT_177845 [Helobdella robusta]ESN97782.1 hypothetical protein HELRODRAFT_177845 [Helobdella robusta]